MTHRTIHPVSGTWWPNLYESEFSCKCGDCNLTWTNADAHLADGIQWARDHLGFPLRVSSWCRCEDYDNTFSSARAHTPNHLTGLCHSVDIAISGEQYYRLMDLVERHSERVGIRGIGEKQHGPHSKRFVHFDRLPTRRSGVITRWTYK